MAPVELVPEVRSAGSSQDLFSGEAINSEATNPSIGDSETSYSSMSSQHGLSSVNV